MIRDQSPLILRPFRTAFLITLGLEGLVVVSVPFIDVPSVNPSLVIIVGIGYSLLLAFLGVGLGLAARSPFCFWWQLSSIFLVVILCGFFISLQLYPEFIFHFPLEILLGILGAYLVFGCAVSGSGWFGYFRWIKTKSGP